MNLSSGVKVGKLAVSRFPFTGKEWLVLQLKGVVVLCAEACDHCDPGCYLVIPPPCKTHLVEAKCATNTNTNTNAKYVTLAAIL